MAIRTTGTARKSGLIDERRREYVYTKASLANGWITILKRPDGEITKPMGLRDLIRRLRARPPSGDRVELKPAEQVALALIIRAGSASEDSIRTAVESHSAVLAPELAEVLTALASQGLAEVRLEPDIGRSRTTLFVTAKGRKLRGRIPEDPRTVTEFWI
jgi:hypothetical protein